MKILKIICLTMLELLIYINPFKFDFLKDGLFIVIVILGFANLHIDTLAKKIKKQWQIQTQTKKTFLKTYTFLNICICLSPFIYSFLIKIKNYDYLLSVIFFIPFIYFFVELRKLTDLILAIDIKLKNINDNVLSFVRESEILYSFSKEKEDNKKE
ncbi:hypothetical protein [Campylobacter sp. TTU_617]|uniref:hypothetical protein n=1 Tax=Campylobacter sp. TTU_617 TaxID=2768148 RepID=UPI001908EC1D|nr:hypothetical protein [Campylobacter sp. TTU_617]MBK1971037.1 hypothetical protein [Campylobacter sp. TTU_617]